ncbi:hypothetical protein SAMN05216598_5402 [Pseudomonas asplenii]|uniref:Uncharacterized protein n=1 Tax=Pseudomonas asplenii TaxID=53407 RepID=A0A1H1ZY44_9PSED|nr:hypothetical protein SAMN05216598_5402 [Pseudomonas asplenii]
MALRSSSCANAVQRFPSTYAPVAMACRFGWRAGKACRWCAQWLNRHTAGGEVNGPETRRGAEAPLECVLCALFLLLRGGLLLFLSTVALYRCSGDPHPGSKSKHIFLSADLPYQVIQPVRGYLEVVLLFSARLRVTRRLPESTPAPKESVSCVSAVLFLLCQSRYVLFLWVCCFLFLLCQRYSRWRANF